MIDDTKDTSTMEEGVNRVKFSEGNDGKGEDSDKTFSRRSFGLMKSQYQSVRHDISFKSKKFETKTLPMDVQRVYKQLKEDHGEEYALIWVFSMRTAVELHRGWHMPLLTSKILQQIKDKFKMRMTWNLGMVKLIFRVEDGEFELQRKIPFDYDSEYQDLFTKVATAFVNENIDIHQALIFQTEIKKGLHTAKSGRYIMRSYPGRLFIYPLQAASCALIFFDGGFSDAGVAAICGFTAGLIEWAIDSSAPGDLKILKDVIVGTFTGIIASIAFRFDGDFFCLKSIFMGTLYWFFYGTAFVAGILEIVSGEIETGVTRFVAVTIKTFVLSLGAAFGMAVVFTFGYEYNTIDAWYLQGLNCTSDRDFINNDLYRIIIYIVCSFAVLGQYRFPIVNWWRGVLVQVAGYVVQYKVQQGLEHEGKNTNLDTAISNIAGAMAAVIVSDILAAIVDGMLKLYNARILHRNKKVTKVGTFFYKITAFFVRASYYLGCGKEADLRVLNMKSDLRQQRLELHSDTHARSEINITSEQQRDIQEAIVSAEPLSTWSILMPAVYQLVPGSHIANLWFGTIFPYNEDNISEDVLMKLKESNYKASDSGQVFELLMVISTSLALGLLLGFAVTNNVSQMMQYFSHKSGLHKIYNEGDDEDREKSDNHGYRKQLMALGMDDNPMDRNEESVRNLSE
eukprot:CAMPEP_0194132738 /NCGR_PEP_ID=MMETSP0152-20130528/3142_1 /TAXON_ID=1049557 /ORGANISM="Thalassiothrix antarctica, Strain L6-D1" /LENGTH=680 /DNA_ID=CAMNT_0038827897 /DNA_START=79 /DNA_END=2121 /DNA_ORIENTATION=+